VNIVFGIAPIVSFALVGLENDFGLQPNLYALMNSCVFILYACGEEFGWRGYLQNELSPLNRWTKYLIIGVIWWLWHWRFNTGFDLILFPIITITSSLIIGKLTDDTHSYFVAASIHGLVMILSLGDWSANKTFGLTLTILIWLLLSFYEKEHRRTALYTGNVS
jgi:membrane protease YdiL (CAAX protease family)